MKERPILFSAPMVRAILEGRKTQTRRVAPIKSLKINRPNGFDFCTWELEFDKPIRGAYGSISGGTMTNRQAREFLGRRFCPYGDVGDRLWVRETFAPYEHDDEYLYRATIKEDTDYSADEIAQIRFKPSIHMPRKASRIDLEIIGVRVERLNDISEDDSIAEGIANLGNVFDCWKDYQASNTISGCAHSTPDLSFRSLWESINGDGSWEKNPWVWAIEFKKV
jgi:hypothetical protein